MTILRGSILHEFSNWTDVLRFAGGIGYESWTYIILGEGGPTGKSFLCDQLRKNGYNAVEISEEVCDLVNYRDRTNHYRIDWVNKKVVIVLNRPLPKDIYPGIKNDNPNPSQFALKDWMEVKQYETRGEVEKLLNHMKRMAICYGCVTRADWKIFNDIDPEPTDHKYGWTESEVKRARIIPGPFGWFVEFPRATPLV